MSGTSTSVVGGGGGGEGGMGYGYGYRPPFTAVQWQELEHQAMIYKYLVAGLPVPPDLVVPIRRSFEAISARFFHHPSCMLFLASLSYFIYIYLKGLVYFDGIIQACRSEKRVLFLLAFLKIFCLVMDVQLLPFSILCLGSE